MIFKDGSEGDEKLDRLVEFDERSRSFPLITRSLKHRSYTWRCLEHLDQGREGSCVGHGITHELIARPAEVKDVDGVFAKDIYHAAQKIDPWPGGSYPGADPVYEGTSILAGVKACQKLGYFESYRWAFSLNDLILGVGHNGPAILGISWYDGMRNTDRQGYITPTGHKIGGHCILCKAVNLKKTRFTLHNSWGTSWGKKGDCYVSFNDMDKLLRDKGEAVFLLRRHTKKR